MVINLKPLTAEHRRRHCAIQITMAFAVLLSGILIGFGGTVVLLRNRLIRAQRIIRPTDAAATIASKMEREYHLTASQRQAVEESVAKHLNEIVETRQNSLSRVRTSRNGFLAEMKEILPPPNYKQLAQQFETKERRFRWFFGLPEDVQCTLVPDLDEEPPERSAAGISTTPGQK